VRSSLTTTATACPQRDARTLERFIERCMDTGIFQQIDRTDRSLERLRFIRWNLRLDQIEAGETEIFQCPGYGTDVACALRTDEDKAETVFRSAHQSSGFSLSGKLSRISFGDSSCSPATARTVFFRNNVTARVRIVAAMSTSRSK